MASGGKKKTTMAKLTRESRLRQRRLDKQAKKEARKLAPIDGPEEHSETLDGEIADTAQSDVAEGGAEAVAQAQQEA
jgi:hypothetical protein